MRTVILPFKMTQRKPLTVAPLMVNSLIITILMISIFRGHTLTCHRTEYQIGGECCPMCPPGSRVKTDCTEFRSTSCLLCVDGTFTIQPTGLKQCFPCANCDAGSGLKIKTSCTTTSDTVCEPLDGFYCVDSTEDRCVAAEKHTHCLPGQYIRQNGTAVKDTVCAHCSGGTFSDGTLFTSCRPHTQCESKGLQLIKPGNASVDAECGEQRPVVHGIVIGVVVLILVCVVLVLILYVYFRKKKGFPHKESNRNADNAKQNPQQEEGAEMIPKKNSWRVRVNISSRGQD